MSTTTPAVLARIESEFESLSPRLKEAARFVLSKPKEIALYSMRTAAERASVHPTSMLRLAREMGFDGYDAFRDEFRDWLNRSKGDTWSGRAHNVQTMAKSSPKYALFESVFRQEVANLQSMLDETLYKQLNIAADRIRAARKVYILGQRSLYPVAFYTAYVCKMFMPNVILMNGLGGTFADELRNIGRGDVLIALSYQPYTVSSIKGVEFAISCGAKVIAITDSVVSPIAKKNQTNLIVPNESPTLFHTILPGLATAQALTALLLADASDETMAEIRRSENQLDAFGVYSR
ncbi:MurR/RpiR family transcriptional regulator [Caballeronia cordobensis]|uniref:MurR/RpiR family transcriptional regulator n=1 Tax=Caballeronia cordobensis TaxID=1353886 RepID=UPI0005EFF950